MLNKLLAEFIGTFWLVLGGCGSAVLAATFPEVGIGLTGVSLAFGLTVLTAALVTISSWVVRALTTCTVAQATTLSRFRRMTSILVWGTALRTTSGTLRVLVAGALLETISFASQALVQNRHW